MTTKAKSSDLEFCEKQIDLMLYRSKTKVIFPIITHALLAQFCQEGKDVFNNLEVKRAYKKSVAHFKTVLGHNFHFGAKYYDAYPTRNLTQYGVVETLSSRTFKLLPEFRNSAEALLEVIPAKVKEYIEQKLGVVPMLENPIERTKLSIKEETFVGLINNHIDKNAINFEIFCFAIIKVHLEKFACKLYRDTRTSAHDKGVDISTNFGVVYQIKKLKVLNKKTADDILGELKINFDSERMTDGKVILVIDDISKEFKTYLINMRVQSISKGDLLKLAGQLELEEREKALRVVFEEFNREYSSDL